MTHAPDDKRPRPKAHALIEAKRLYFDPRLTLDDAARFIGVTRGTLIRWAREEGWPRRGDLRLSGAREAGGSWVGKACPGLASCPERAEEVARAWAAARAQVEAVTARTATLGPDGDIATEAKLLGTVVRTLKELAEIDAKAAAEARKAVAEARKAGAAGDASAEGETDDKDALGRLVAEMEAALRRLG
jgi:hypothetical protein